MMQSKRPRWSLVSNFAAAVFVMALSAVVVILVVKKPIWTELEIVTGIISIFAFLYFYYVLYSGVRFLKDGKFSIVWRPFRSPNWADSMGWGIDTQGAFTEMGTEAGIIGIIIGLILDIVVSIFLVVLIAWLIWLLTNMALVSIPIMAAPLFWVFSKSLRTLVVQGRKCHKDHLKSITFSLRSTLLYVGWFYIVISAAKWVSVRYF